MSPREPFIDELDRLVSAFRDGQLRARARTNGSIAPVGEAINRLIEELLSRQTYIDNVLESLADALIVVNQNGTLRTVNDATCQLLGYEEDELLGRMIASLIKQQVPVQSNLPIIGLATHFMWSLSRDVDTLFIAKDGTLIPTLVNAAPIKDDEGMSTGTVMLARDMRETRALIEEAARAEAEAERADELAAARDKLEQANSELQEMQGQLMDASRQAGKAEVATSVLHNVGNVLNSVNVSTSLVAEELHNSKLAGVAKLAKLLEQKQDDLSGFFGTAKGQKIPAYLKELSGRLAQEHERINTEIKRLEEKVDHIKAIVSAQQNVGKQSSVVELLNFNEVVDKAMEMRLSKNSGIEIEPRFADIPFIQTDRHKITEIVVNLVGNAQDALLEYESERKKIIVQTRAAGSSRVAVDVIDNGVGIAEETLQQIFTHGFTTKKTGHGFGLHSSANAAKECGGSLVATSEGLGHGATFTLELPVVSKKANK